MFRRLLQSGPKYVISALVVLGSLAGFGLWLTSRTKKLPPGVPSPIVVVDNTPKLAAMEANIGRLLLVDNDLYDLGTGELLFSNWLKNGMPVKLSWEANSKTLLAQYERGFVRYGLDGIEKQSLWQRYPFGVADDLKWIVFAKERDIWRADVDWTALTLRNERKLTSIEQINEQNFAANIILSTDMILIVRSMPNLLRVDMESSEVHPTKIPLGEIGKRRSPDNKSVVGIQNGQFYCYDIDKDETKSLTVGRGAINDYQWLGNDNCVAIAAMKTVVIYDRLKHSLTELVALPSLCYRIGEPSPDGRYVFCSGRNNGVLVDTEKKTAVPVVGGAGVCWVSADSFAFTREVPDSGLRGTWLQKVGEEERRVSPEPYLVGKSGPMLMVRKAIIVFATKHGLATMNSDGTEAAEVVKLQHPPNLALGIEEWAR